MPINKDFLEDDTTPMVTQTSTDKMTDINRSSDKFILDTNQEIYTTTQETTQENRSTTQETTQENIINMIKKKPQITLQEIADILKLTRDGVKYHITKLQEEGIIKHEGTTKSGKWITIKED